MKMYRLAKYGLMFALVIGLVVGSVLFFRPGRRGVGRSSGGATAHRPESDNLQQTTMAEANAPEKVVKTVSSQPLTGPSTHTTKTWNRFRGPEGRGISDDSMVPTSWSDNENLKWKLELPGPGSSSPVLTDKFVFVTSYTGYGLEGRSPGTMESLKRHLHCVDRADGKLIWTKSVDAVLPDDPYQGMGITEHGYATNTPTTDGENVYAFFGKSGVRAYDMSGNELWQASVGTESGNRGWGTASSLLLYKDLLIVNASEESQSIVALDRKTGQSVWSAPASSLELAYGTPTIVRVSEDRDDLVVAVPGEVWGLNPTTGKLVWFVETSLAGNLSPSVVQEGEMLYVFGGYKSTGSLAIRTGGTGDVTKSHIAWTSRNTSYVVTPVLHDGHLYWIDDQGLYFCVKASSGDLVQKKRVSGIDSRGRLVYASPVLINGKIYAQTRESGLFVLAGEPELNILSQNRFESDTGIFNGTPAVGDGQLFLRSYSSLYCVESRSNTK